MSRSSHNRSFRRRVFPANHAVALVLTGADKRKKNIKIQEKTRKLIVILSTMNTYKKNENTKPLVAKYTPKMGGGVTGGWPHRCPVRHA